MSALAKNFFPHLRSPGAKTQRFLAAAQTFYHGALVAIDKGTGLLVNWLPTTNLTTMDFKGLCLENKTANGTTDTIIVDVGGSLLEAVPVAGAAQSAVGDPVYCPTNNPETDLSLSVDLSSRKIGYLDFYNSATDCRVRILTPGEYLGNILP